MRKLALGLVLSIAGAAAIVLSAGHDATAGGNSVTQTGIDLDVTGNTGNSLGTIESTLGNIPLNTPFEIDIYAKGVPVADPGLNGVGGELIFDGSIVEVINPVITQALPVLHYSHDTANIIPFEVFDPRPNSTGIFRFDSIDLQIPDASESGDGVLIRLTLQCKAEGVTHLGITDVSTSDPPTLGVLGGPNGFFDVEQELEADIGCGVPLGGTTTPAPTTPAPTTPAPTDSETPEPTTPGPTTPAPTDSETPEPTTPGPTTPAPTDSETPEPTTPGPTTPAPTTPAPTTPGATTPPPTTPVTATPTPTPTPTPSGTKTATPTATAAPVCNSTLAANAAAGATQITVVSATGCGAGDKITIGAGSNAETVTVQSVSGNTITLTAALTRAHNSGETVVEVASATPTATPAGLPRTGGGNGDSGISTPLLVLVLGAALIAAAAGGLTFARAPRKE